MDAHQSRRGRFYGFLFEKFPKMARKYPDNGLIWAIFAKIDQLRTFLEAQFHQVLPFSQVDREKVSQDVRYDPDTCPGT